MATTIYSYHDGHVRRDAEASWDDAHDAATGEYYSAVLNRYSVALRASYAASGRGAGWHVSRCFFSFDTSGIVHVPKSAAFKVKGYATNAITIIHCVKATNDIESPSGITTADFISIEGWDERADNTGNVTYYAPNSSVWAIGSHNTFVLNGQALVDIAGQNFLNIALLANDDITNDESFPPPISTAYSGVYFSPYSGTGSDPYLSIVEQDDAIFFGHNF